MMAERQARLTYQRQGGIHRRTDEVIIEAARLLVNKNGLHKTNMIDIADRAQVSRASLYNHFRDKEQVFLGLIESEVKRLYAIALNADSRAESLFLISREISTHQSLASALLHDPAALAQALTAREHKIWVTIYTSLATIFAADVIGVGMIVRWLLGQVTAPLSEEHSRLQSERLSRSLS